MAASRARAGERHSSPSSFPPSRNASTRPATRRSRSREEERSPPVRLPRPPRGATVATARSAAAAVSGVGDGPSPSNRHPRAAQAGCRASTVARTVATVGGWAQGGGKQGRRVEGRVVGRLGRRHARRRGIVCDGGDAHAPPRRLGNSECGGRVRGALEQVYVDSPLSLPPFFSCSSPSPCPAASSHHGYVARASSARLRASVVGDCGPFAPARARGERGAPSPRSRPAARATRADRHPLLPPPASRPASPGVRSLLRPLARRSRVVQRGIEGAGQSAPAAPDTRRPRLGRRKRGHTRSTRPPTAPPLQPCMLLCLRACLAASIGRGGVCRAANDARFACA